MAKGGKSWIGGTATGKSSTGIDKGSASRGGAEHAVTTSRIMGRGSNEATYAAMKGNVDVRHKSHGSLPPAPRGKSERGPGGWE